MSQQGRDDVVANVGDEAITLDDVDRKAIEMTMNAQQLYEARKNAVAELIAESLLRQAAAERGVSVDELVEEEINTKIQAVTEADVEQFYEGNRARMGGQTLESIGPQIRAYLESQSEAVAKESFLTELRDAAVVSVALQPPRTPITVAANEPSKGPEEAPITIVEYSDFQ
jgi:hypothetical protein